jgi:electron transfer flavoprotein alpha subunit
MAKVLVYSDDAGLAAELAAFDSSVSNEVSVLAFGTEDAAALGSCGASRLLVAEGIDVPEASAKSLADYVRAEGFGLVIVGATSRGRDLAAQLAGYLECGMGGDVSNLSFDGQFIAYERNRFGGAVVSSETIDGLGVVTVGRGAYEPREAAVAATERIALEADARVTLVARDAAVAEGIDIATADRIVGVGMGVSSQEDLELVREVVDALDGALGCSRGMAEERGWVPADQYIGISGKVVAPKLYLTMGVSGQVQHLYGVRDAKIIAAIDKNEKAPICANADYYIVGDLKEYAPLIAAEIKAR